MPVSNTPVAEVSTNVAFRVRCDVAQTFALRLEAVSVSSNAVQVAFGTDADGNGDLAAEETDLVLGLEPGLAFIENVAEEIRTETLTDEPDGTGRRLEMTIRTNGSQAIKSCSFTNETGACFADISSTTPAWAFSPDWNLFKVTRRGAYGSNERIHVGIVCYPFTIRIR